MSRGHFFQIDRDAWNRVASQVLNASVAYLVMACGTGRDNRTTAWSVNAIEKYTGIGRSLAKRAIDALQAIGAATQTQGGKHPRYCLKSLLHMDKVAEPNRKKWPDEPDPHWIWLPNSLVTGAVGERPPIERVRALQDVRTLQQLVAAYDTHDLAENGGIHWRNVRMGYKRTRLTERGVWVLWGFDSETNEAWPAQSLWDPFRQGEDKWGKERSRSDFWESWNNLIKLGLLERVPHLIEADSNEAAMICPCPGDTDDGTPAEKALGNAAREAAEVMLGAHMGHLIDDHNAVIPIPEGFPKVEMVGIYRLRYRPHTAKTAAWIAKSEGHEEWRSRFEALARAEDPFVKKSAA